uniref:Uncharacterized protein n=1 Tax=uncultured Armatimonadetes bacterium TaxID=157466 RepID=A0A6J4JLT6_9BACT|nr:hypothetical protein AVDCRST_MAG63-3622 [uncultured Armatimonadetes bacterium]
MLSSRSRVPPVAHEKRPGAFAANPGQRSRRLLRLNRRRADRQE